MEKTKIITFQEVIKVGGAEFASVELRQPSAGEMAKAAMEPNAIYTVIALVSLIGKIPRKVVEQMVDTDLEDCSDFLGSFMAARAERMKEQKNPAGDNE